MPFVSNDSVQLYYEPINLTDPKPCLLFLHGLGSSTRDWELQTSELMQDFAICLVDLRGHGRSDKPPGPYSIAQFADDVACLVDRLALRRVHLVGLSLGGAIALELGCRCPSWLASLTVANMVADIPVKTWERKRLFFTRWLIVKLCGPGKMGEWIAKQVFPEEHQQYLRDLMKQRWMLNDKQAYLAALMTLKNWSVLDRVKHIQVPTLAIHAEYDYTPVAAKQQFVDRIPNARLEQISGARHIVNFDHPQEFNRLVKDFILQQQAPVPGSPAPELRVPTGPNQPRAG